jgi:FtsZ-interacting cell division protein ZipA
MSTLELVIVIVVALVVVAIVVAAAWAFSRRRRTERLHRRFGPEYEHTVTTVGDRRQAEAELANREKRAKSLQTRPLSREEVERFSEVWRGVQSRFVDQPTEAITDAENLVIEVMQARGYPAVDVEQRVDYLSVDHPRAAQNYRAAHGITQKTKSQEATTEDLRQAMTYYRELFNELLGTKIQERLQWQSTSSSPS